MKTLVTALTVALYLVFLSFQPALAGAPPLQWQKTFGGIGWDEGRSVQQTSDGGYIITGFTRSFGQGDADVYLVKTDSNGNDVWQKNYGGIGDDKGAVVHQTSDSGYIIAGQTDSFGAGSSDVYLVKTDPNGNSIWQKTFGGASIDRAFSLQKTSDNGYIIAGYTLSSGVGNYDVYLIKTDTNGNKKWQKTFGGNDRDVGRSVQQTSDSGYVIAGYTQSYGMGYHDVYLIKTNPNGDMQWQKTFGGSGNDIGDFVQQTADSGYIIVGNTRSYGAGSEDVYLIKTDPNGNTIWQQTFGGIGFDEGRSVQQTSDGGYIIAGYTQLYDTGRYDMYLIKTDPNGNSEWQKIYGGINGDIAKAVQQTSDGGYIIAGLSEFEVLIPAGKGDVCLLKLCPDGTLSADFNCNGIVSYEDLHILHTQWHQLQDFPSAGIAPEIEDGIVNFLDFAVFANDWLQTTIP